MESCDIERFKFRFKINNIKDLDMFESKKVQLCGGSWMILAERDNDNDEDELSLYLCAQNDDESEHWVTIASCTFTLISSKENKTIYKEPFAFNKFTSNWGQSIVTWKALMNPKNGYVVNDTCELIIKIEASPAQDIRNDDRLKFDIIQKCCNANSYAKFRLTIKKFDDFYGVCSPTFVLGGYPCNIFAYKNKYDDENFPTTKKFLRICLSNHFENETNNWTCAATMLCKIESFDPQIQPVESKFENFELKYPRISKYVDLIRWDDLVDPEKHFVKENSIVVEVEVKFDGKNRHGRIDNPVHPKRAKRSIFLEAFPNQNLSNLKCGHAFCTPCIDRAVQNVPRCPVCNTKAEISDLRPIYF